MGGLSFPVFDKQSTYFCLIKYHVMADMSTKIVRLAHIVFGSKSDTQAIADALDTPYDDHSQ